MSKSIAILFVKTARHIQRPLPVLLFADPVQWVDAGQCLRVTLDTQLTWSIDTHKIGKKAAQRLGMLGPLLNIISGQLIPSMVAYACSMWKSVARTHVRKLQMLKSRCLPWYLSNKQIQGNLAVPFFADHFGNFEGTCADHGMTVV